MKTTKATFFTFVNAYDKLFVFISFSETKVYCKGTKSSAKVKVMHGC